MYKFNKIPFKIPIAFFVLHKLKNNYKTHMESQKSPEWPKQSWQEKQNWMHHKSRFLKHTTKLQKLNQYGTGIKKHIGQWNRRENQEVNPHLYDQLPFNKDAKNTQQGRIVSSTNCADNLSIH